MNTVRDSHNAAMEHYDQAVLAERQSRHGDALGHWREALRFEAEALHQLALDGRPEPSYSVFARSAACMALKCAEPRVAEQLACEGLAGDPPSPIDEELREVLGQAQEALRTASATGGVGVG